MAGLGGGLWYGGVAVVTDSSFYRNAAIVGGGLSADRLGELTLTRCVVANNIILENVAGGGGAGIGIYGGTLTVANSWIIGNYLASDIWTSYGCGGALINANAIAEISNTVFLGNSAHTGGGLCAINGSEVHVANCTFAMNEAVGYLNYFGDGAGIITYRAILTIVNSILWDEQADGNREELTVRSIADDPADPADVVLKSTCIRGGWSGVGSANIDSDPGFVDLLGFDGIPGTIDDDVRLQSESPCVDAGDNSGIPSDTNDLDGDGDTSEPVPVDLAENARVLGATVDMGAFEREDCNNNGIADNQDILTGTSEDCDGNGVPDECDLDCSSNGVADGCDPDRDADGTIDDCDACPDDAGKVTPGVCGCGVSDADSDGDTVPDCQDVCAGADDLVDTDGDGVADGCDPCNGADTVFDCNHNGYSDPCEVLDGVAADLDGNGMPDACDRMPAVATEGCRTIGVTPAPGTEAVALRVTSRQLACLDRFVTADGSLSDTPIFLTPTAWGSVVIADPVIVPNIRYMLTAENAGGTVSAEAWVTSAPWGDVVGSGLGTPPDGAVDFRDVSGLVGCFLGAADAPPLYRCDIAPATPDGDANFTDIAAAVSGFLQQPYPYSSACP